MSILTNRDIGRKLVLGTIVGNLKFLEGWGNEACLMLDVWHCLVCSCIASAVSQGTLDLY